MLKCERVQVPPPGMVLVKRADGGALFKYVTGATPKPPTSPKVKGRPSGKIVATYPYRDASGKPNITVNWED